MQIRLVLFTFISFCSFLVFAQEFDQFNIDRIDMTKSGMLVLGSWAATNLAVSPFLSNRTTGSTKYFHQMNGYWNMVNLAIAGLGYYNALKANAVGLSLSETLAEQHSIEKILLFNAGLDLAYVAGGLYLMERAKRSTQHDRLKGFGQSLVLQGSFLFAFDVVFYLVQHKHGSKLLEMVDQLALSPTGFSMVWKL